MDGKIFGIPLALIIIILGLALFIVTPVALMQRTVLDEVEAVRQDMNNLFILQQEIASPSATPEVAEPAKVAPTPTTLPASTRVQRSVTVAPTR